MAIFSKISKKLQERKIEKELKQKKEMALKKEIYLAYNSAKNSSQLDEMEPNSQFFKEFSGAFRAGITNPQNLSLGGLQNAVDNLGARSENKTRDTVMKKYKIPSYKLDEIINEGKNKDW